jgi:cellulose synthase/poly-beta-1,6-N-acetylglucosamine synthase-like glycosyltransferase
MILLALVLIAIPTLLAAYSLVVYPFLLLVIARLRPTLPLRVDDPTQWPLVSICVPAYNEERSIGLTLDNLLKLDYPADRRQIVVVSDASTDVPTRSSRHTQTAGSSWSAWLCAAARPPPRTRSSPWCAENCW